MACRPQLVLGFHDNRAAKIVALELSEPQEPGPGTGKFKEILLDASMDSPLGPWRKNRNLELKPDARVSLLKPSAI